jgi:hypothetical protein
MARGFLETVFDGALDEYLMHALQAKRLSVEELSRLEDMIAEAKQQRRKANRGGGP